MTWLRRQQRRRSGRTPQACKNQTNGHQPGLEGQVASMNDISISSISANLGLGGLLTDQTLTLATEYGLNFVAALITVIIGIWASRRLSGLLRNWLTGSSRIDQTLTPILAALVRYAILTLTVVVTLGNFGVETTSIIAVLGAAGLAIGLVALAPGRPLPATHRELRLVLRLRGLARGPNLPRPLALPLELPLPNPVVLDIQICILGILCRILILLA